MGSKKLRRVGLSQELCDRLNRHQIVTCQDFLCLTPLELMKMTGLSYQGVHELLCVVSRACAPRMQTAYEIKTQRSAAPSSAFLSTTLSALDEALHGGVACGSLTEITGPPGCGKTQFCIMMSILATLPTNMGGLEGAVVYVDTESAFSAERLVEIAESRFPRYFNTEEKLLLTSSKVHLYRELSCDEVLQRIESLEEEIISKGVKLVIIDSVASVVRKEFDTQLQGNMRERNKFLAREAASLKYLAEEFSIPVILTNQITTHLSGALASQADLVSPADDLSLSEGTSGSSCVTAALGNTWSHSVNTRLILQYLGSERRQVSALTMFSDSQGQGTRYTSNMSVHLLKALATLSVLGQHCQRVGKETSLPAYLNSSSNKWGDKSPTGKKIQKQRVSLPPTFANSL
ncbi:DNA repair protein RAD51 homolog 2 isoform X1 [Phocoena sinus]|uniref:DNA repair protein RAD51 homolog 2 isoform X1 n=1 Tax=Phocoena sinus TaxID=42100 RepID=UPI0013C46C1B|nr:DNA repair protein RAD51 homolog 2 isoform X1 [Phocoena sinus]